MSRHLSLSSLFSGAIAKIFPHAKNLLSVQGSFFNQFVTDIYIYINTYINRVLIGRMLKNQKLRIIKGNSEVMNNDESSFYFLISYTDIKKYTTYPYVTYIL